MEKNQIFKIMYNNISYCIKNQHIGLLKQRKGQTITGTFLNFIDMVRYARGRI
jgi:hypothetical protein